MCASSKRMIREQFFEARMWSSVMTRTTEFVREGRHPPTVRAPARSALLFSQTRFLILQLGEQALLLRDPV